MPARVPASYRALRAQYRARADHGGAACRRRRWRRGDAVLVAAPADHAVADTEAFRRAVALAVRHADWGAIVTLACARSLPRPAMATSAPPGVNAWVPTASSASSRSPTAAGQALRRGRRLLVEQRHLRGAGLGLAQGDARTAAGDPALLPGRLRAGASQGDTVRPAPKPSSPARPIRSTMRGDG